MMNRASSLIALRWRKKKAALDKKKADILEKWHAATTLLIFLRKMAKKALEKKKAGVLKKWYGASVLMLFILKVAKQLKMAKKAKALLRKKATKKRKFLPPTHGSHTVACVPGPRKKRYALSSNTQIAYMMRLKKYGPGGAAKWWEPMVFVPLIDDDDL
jgi:hypothetical protein